MKRMCLVLALVLSFPALRRATAEINSIKIDHLIDAYVKTGRFQGSVLLAKQGEVVYQKGFGFANAEWSVPNKPETKFRVASITKQFTAMLVVQLIADGKLKLNGKLSDYVPEWPKATGEQITILELLTHQSGIPDYTNPAFGESSCDPNQRMTLAKSFWGKPLDFAPGSRFSYSNSGYYMLGVVIERVTGKPYERVLRERILEPLSMNDSGFDDPDAVLPNRAAGYQRTPAGLRNAPAATMCRPYSAGGMYSTVLDLGKWDAALYTDKLVDRKYIDLIFQPAVKTGDHGDSYGFGWRIANRSMPGVTRTVHLAEHSGHISGFSTFIVRIKDDRHLIVLLGNEARADCTALANGITQILYGGEAEAPKTALSDVLGRSIVERGVEWAVREFRDLKQNHSAEYSADEAELNSLGYYFLAKKKTSEAVAVFKLNVELFPNSWSVYDSLGEAYAVAGNRELAIQNYERAHKLDPSESSPEQALKRLKAR